MLIDAHQVKRHQGDTVTSKAKAPVLENTSRKAVATPTESGVLSRPDFLGVSKFGCIDGFGRDGFVRKAGRTSLRVFSTSRPSAALENVASGFKSRKGAIPMTTIPLASRCAVPTSPTSNTSDTTSPSAPTLEDFTDWLLERHGATFDAMDTAPEGDAFRALLDSFARTNTALNLLTEFRTAHATQAAQEGGSAR